MGCGLVTDSALVFKEVTRVGLVPGSGVTTYSRKLAGRELLINGRLVGWLAARAANRRINWWCRGGTPVEANEEKRPLIRARRIVASIFRHFYSRLILRTRTRLRLRLKLTETTLLLSLLAHRPMLNYYSTFCLVIALRGSEYIKFIAQRNFKFMLPEFRCFHFLNTLFLLFYKLRFIILLIKLLNKKYWKNF